MATVIEIQSKIDKLEKGLKLKAISALQKTKMRKQIKELKSELAEAKKSSKKPAKKATTKKKAKFNEQDAQRPAKPIGRRTSASGNRYYEYRENRSDKKQPPKRYPRLEDGGMMARGGGLRSEKDFQKLVADKTRLVEKLTPKEIADMWNKNSFGVKEGISKPMTLEYAKNPQAKMYLRDLLVENEISEEEYQEYFADGGMMDEYSKGGLFGSNRNLSRDRMFKSQEDWEQSYKRKSRPKNPRYNYADGGSVNSKKYILMGYYADAYEDSYEEGELSRVSSWDEKMSKTFDSKKELIDYINKNIINSDYGMDDFDWDSGDGKYIQTSVLCSYDEYGGYYPSASESEKQLWMEGKIKLYSVNYTINVIAFIPTEYEDGGLTTVGGTTFSDVDLSGLTNNDISAGYFAKGGGVGNKNFENGEIVWDAGNKRYGIVLNNYGGNDSEVRLDSDGNQPVDNLHKLGSKGDKGTKEQLQEALFSHKRLVDEYNYDRVAYAKGGKVSNKYKYIPNRMIQSVEVERNGKETEIDGADVLDGVYVKKKVKFADGGEMHKTDMYAKGGMTEHGLKKGDEIEEHFNNVVVVENDDKNYVVNLNTGQRWTDAQWYQSHKSDKLSKMADGGEISKYKHKIILEIHKNNDSVYEGGEKFDVALFTSKGDALMCVRSLQEKAPQYYHYRLTSN